MNKPLRIDASAVPARSWDDPARGTLTWTPLFSKDTTATGALVCGISDIQPGQHFALHSHPEPEVYFGISGGEGTEEEAFAFLTGTGADNLKMTEFALCYLATPDRPGRIERFTWWGIEGRRW